MKKNEIKVKELKKVLNISELNQVKGGALTYGREKLKGT